MDKAAKYAAERGLTLDTELNLRDLGVSAYRQSNAKKGALGEFLRAVADGYVARGSYLLIENMDRLTRDEIVGATGLFLQLIGDGIVVVTLTNNEVFSQERFDRQPWAMHLIVAELTRANQESARKSQLVGDAKRRKKQQLIDHGLNGKPYTRQTPAWIRWDDAAKKYTLISERAAIVREVFERTDAGHGIDRIAKDLNQRGVDTWGGRKGQRQADHWRGSYIRKILLSTAPIGTFTPHTTTHDGVTRARRDEPMTPVENMFPKAIEDEELYWRINRRFATTAPRGRNARHAPKSIVAGIAHCATCGHSVTRVSKGGYVYLVCSRANMRAAGCKYLAVPYPLVEEALRKNVRTLVAHAPRGKSTAALEKQIAAMQADADHLEGLTFELAELAASEKSVAAKRRLSDAERELRVLQKSLRDLRAQRDTLTTASVKDRLNAVQKVLSSNTSVAETNQALRQAMQRIMLDPEQGRLWIRWHHSEEMQDIVCVSKHKSWDETEITPPPITATNEGPA
jgi:hypothetical protein